MNPGRNSARAAIALLLLAAAPLSGAADQVASEHAVKAAIIYKIAKFVTWPTEASEGNQDTLPICLPAADPIGPALESL
ncbi:MAG: YfiR family protein, partial [Gammaproteobacteria bacterium]|nr:YfiR family protein [Gammaproteobacteria bacterium]